MQAPPPLQLADYLGPMFAALVFVLIMSCVKEPARREYNAILVAGASGVYMNGGFGLWELLYTAAVGGVVAYLGLRSYFAVGLGWLLHAGWDWLHHLYGTVIWAFMPTSSFGCMVFDTLIAVWFMAGAPALLARHAGAAAIRSQRV